MVYTLRLSHRIRRISTGTAIVTLSLVSPLALVNMLSRLKYLVNIKLPEERDEEKAKKMMITMMVMVMMTRHENWINLDITCLVFQGVLLIRVKKVVSRRI